MVKLYRKAAIKTACFKWLSSMLLIAIMLLPLTMATSPVSADGPPALPAIFYGTVTISGSPAIAGTVIEAQINSVVQGSFPVTTAGSYGNMLVTNGNNGDTVQFYVGGVAAQSAIYRAGERNAVNLSTGGGGGAPVAPVLSSPTSGAVGVSTTPTLQWIASSGATTYGVQVSTSSSFATIAFSQSGIAGTSTAVTPALTAGTLYYWRANATNPSGTSAWATAWSFTTAAVAPPAAPALLSPSNVATGVGNNPLLQWSSSTGATTYSVQVSTSSAFTTFVFTQSGSATAVTVTPALTNSTTYYWRANATSSGGTSSWSSTWSFTTGGGSAPSVPAFFKGIAYKDGVAVYLKQVCAVVNSTPTCVSSDSLGNYLVSVNGSPGDTVTFTVDGSTATETSTFQPGWMANLNLHAGTGVLAVATGNGTYVSSTTATLSGNLVSLSTLDTSATPSIDYGPTIAYEWGTWTMSSMSSPGTFTTPAIGGLSAGQVIHFRAKAVGNTTHTTALGLDATYTHAVPGSLLITDATPLPAATANIAYTKTFSATGGSGTGYTWDLFSRGTLPTAFSLSSGGVLTGTATAAGGPYSFTVRVTDSLSAQATKDFQLTVNAVGALTITDTSPLTSATVNVAYSKTFSASGGSGTGYTWDLFSRGTLPTAFSLSSAGVLTGTATTTGGPYSFTVRVTDSLSAQATKDFQLTVSSGGGVVCGTDPVGCTVGAIWTTITSNQIYASRFVATQSATITKLNIVSTGSGSMKVAVYSDGSGGTTVGTLITTGSGSVVSGTNSITLASSVPVTAGTAYWLVELTDGNTYTFRQAAGGVYAYTLISDYASYVYPSTLTMTYPGPGYSGLVSGN